MTSPNFRCRANFRVYTFVPNFSQFGSVVFSNLCGHGTGDGRRGTRDNGNFHNDRRTQLFSKLTDFPNFFTQHVFNRSLALSVLKFRKNVLFEDFCGLKAKNGCAMAKPNTTHTQRFALRAIPTPLLFPKIWLVKTFLSGV